MKERCFSEPVSPRVKQNLFASVRASQATVTSDLRFQKSQERCRRGAEQWRRRHSASAATPPSGREVEDATGHAVEATEHGPSLGRIHIALEHGQARAAETEQPDCACQAGRKAEPGSGRDVGRRGAHGARHRWNGHELEKRADHRRKHGARGTRRCLICLAFSLSGLSSDDKGTPQGSRCRSRRPMFRTGAPAPSRPASSRRCRGSAPTSCRAPQHSLWHFLHIRR